MSLSLVKDASDGLSFADDARLIEKRQERALDLLDAFKMHMEGAAIQFLERNDATLTDPIFDSFGARSQECLQAVLLGRLNDSYDEIAADYLGVEP